MPSTINVVQCGLGPIGLGTLKEVLLRRDMKLVAAIDVSPDLVGRDISEIAGLPAPTGIRVESDVLKCLARVRADVCLLTTSSSVTAVAEHARPFLERGVRVVTSCEEMSYSRRTHPDVTAALDRLAIAAGSAIVATGVNPGYLMDFLPLVLTGVVFDVEKIAIERIQDASVRRLPFQKKIGAGLTPAEFAKKVAEGTLRHVGLTESMHMIADTLGWRLDKTEETIAPVIAKEEWRSASLVVPPGNVLGVEQYGRGTMDQKEVLTLHFRATVGEKDPRDAVRTEGRPPMKLVIPGGTNGDAATIAILVNACRTIQKAAPGFRTMADLGLVTAHHERSGLPVRPFGQL